MDNTELIPQEEMAAVTTPAKKAKPYTKSEISSLTKEGHVIGDPRSPLTTGHMEETTQKWEKWEIELKMKSESIHGFQGPQGVPYEFYAVKKIRGNMVGSADSFQSMNKQVDFKLTTRPNYHIYHFPAGTVEAGKTMPCSWFIETQGKGVEETNNLRVKFDGIEIATGAPQK